MEEREFSIRFHLLRAGKPSDDWTASRPCKQFSSWSLDPPVYLAGAFRSTATFTGISMVLTPLFTATTAFILAGMFFTWYV